MTRNGSKIKKGGKVEGIGRARPNMSRYISRRKNRAKSRRRTPENFVTARAKGAKYQGESESVTRGGDAATGDLKSKKSKEAKKNFGNGSGKKSYRLKLEQWTIKVTLRTAGNCQWKMGSPRQPELQ